MADLPEATKQSLYRAGHARGKHICKSLEPGNMTLEGLDEILPSVAEMLEEENITLEGVCHISGFVGAFVTEVVKLHQTIYQLQGGGSDDETRH